MHTEAQTTRIRGIMARQYMHRYLRRRLPDYDYDRHFGGVYYLFLRGMRPETGPTCGVFFDRSPLYLVDALDERVFKHVVRGAA